MKITMCEKDYYFLLKDNNVCVLYIPTTNSKLEKFVQNQHSLWQLTGSSLGALRELVAVAGIKKHAECFFKQNLKTNSAAVKDIKSLSLQIRNHKFWLNMSLNNKTIDTLSHQRKKLRLYAIMLMHTKNNPSPFLLRKRSKF